VVLGAAVRRRPQRSVDRIHHAVRRGRRARRLPPRDLCRGRMLGGSGPRRRCFDTGEAGDEGLQNPVRVRSRELGHAGAQRDVAVKRDPQLDCGVRRRGALDDAAKRCNGVRKAKGASAKTSPRRLDPIALRPEQARSTRLRDARCQCDRANSCATSVTSVARASHANRPAWRGVSCPTSTSQRTVSARVSRTGRGSSANSLRVFERRIGRRSS
jgi:hypothetical protein